jgi:hypothetical protein
LVVSLQFVTGAVLESVQVLAALASTGASAIAPKRTSIVMSVAPREAPMMRRLLCWAVLSWVGLAVTTGKSLFSVGMGGTKLLWLSRILGYYGRDSGRIK